MDASLSAPVRAIHRATAMRPDPSAPTCAGMADDPGRLGSKERLENEEWRLTMLAREHCPEDPQSDPGDIALYGEWQTEPRTPEHRAGGLVPKNDYGNVDLYGNALPPLRHRARQSPARVQDGEIDAHRLRARARGV